MPDEDSITCLDLVIDLEAEFGELLTPQDSECQHVWGFVPPGRSAGRIRECRGYGVLVCAECEAIRTASPQDLNDFNSGKISDITSFYSNNGSAGFTNEKSMI